MRYILLAIVFFLFSGCAMETVDYPTNDQTAHNAIQLKQVYVGMHESDVREAWGAPEKISGNTWYYSNRYCVFSSDKRLTDVVFTE